MSRSETFTKQRPETTILLSLDRACLNLSSKIKELSFEGLHSIAVNYNRS